MSFSLLWLPDVLRAAGLSVIENPGWQNRGHGDEGKVLGVLCHHTCGPLHGDLPDINVLIDGRPDLGGPLCNLALGRSGTFYMIAAGKGWHAGAGNWQGVTDGNSHLIGIEAENTGETTGARAEAWPEVQLDAYARGCAAILKHIGAAPIMCAGHKEYALPRGRKDDPDFDMVAFRALVADIMGAPAPAPAPKPAPAPPSPAPAPAPATVAPGAGLSAPFAGAAQVAPHESGSGGSAPPSAFPRKGVISANGVNVRAKAAGDAAVLRVLGNGDQVEADIEAVNGTTTWLGLAGGGYVAARFVDLA